MPLSSPFKRLKSRLRDKLRSKTEQADDVSTQYDQDTLVQKDDDIPTQKDHDAPTEQVPKKKPFDGNLYANNRRRYECTVSPDWIPNTTADLCSAVTIALRNIIDAQSGAATTAEVVYWAAVELSDLLGLFCEDVDKGTDDIVACYRQWGIYQCHTRIRRNGKMREIMNPILRYHSYVNDDDFCLTVADAAGIDFDDTEGMATEKALKYAARIVMDVAIKAVRTQIDTIHPNTPSVAFIGEFIWAVGDAASEKAMTIAENYESSRSPPYTP